MNIKYVSNDSDTELSKSYQILSETNEEVGSAEGYVSRYGDLVTVIKIYDQDYKQRGLGFEIFKKIFDELDKIVSIKTIKGSWYKGGEFQDFEENMSTNLKIFTSCMESEKDEQKCAFRTPTGKWAQKLGYNNCNVLLVSTDEVTVDFTK